MAIKPKDTAAKISFSTKIKKAIVSLDAEVYSKDGKKVSNFTLPEEIFALPWNADLVYEVVVGMQANARHSTATPKTAVKYAVAERSHGRRRVQVALDMVQRAAQSGAVVE